MTTVYPTGHATAHVTLDELKRQYSGGMESEFARRVGAALASAVAIRKTCGSFTPYSVPLVLAALKLPTGAVTALAGPPTVPTDPNSSVTAPSGANVAAPVQSTHESPSHPDGAMAGPGSIPTT